MMMLHRCQFDVISLYEILERILPVKEAKSMFSGRDGGVTAFFRPKYCITVRFYRRKPIIFMGVRFYRGNPILFPGGIFKAKEKQTKE